MAASNAIRCILTCTLCALAACSNGPPAGAAPPSASATLSKAGNACERKLLSVNDMADVLGKPATRTKALKGDPQTCYFITGNDDEAGPELMVSVRPGFGVATLATFSSGQMDAYVKSVPLSGVGDGAVWKPDLLEVTAQKNNVLCEVRPGPMSTSPEFAHAGEATQQQVLGALCNKVFAAF